MGVQFIMYIGIMWKLLFGPYKWKITLSMNLLGTGVTLAPSGLSSLRYSKLVGVIRQLLS